MQNKLNKILSVFVVLSVLFCNLSVFAIAEPFQNATVLSEYLVNNSVGENESINSYDEAEKVINFYKTSDDVFTVIGAKSLYSLAGGAEYTYYELAPFGYAILLNNDFSLMEACYADIEISDVLADTATSVFYCGPGNYLVQEDQIYCNLLSGEQLSVEEIILLENVESSFLYSKSISAELVSMTKSDANSVLRTTEEMVNAGVAYDYFSSLTKYGLNVNGTCTIISIAMLLGYYDNFVNDDYVPTTFEDGNGTTEEFHQALNQYVYGEESQGGIFIHDAIEEINIFLNNLGFHSELVSVNSGRIDAVNAIIDQLESGEPVIASMGTHINAPYDHSVLIYHVTYNMLNPTDSAVFTMNMGWNSLDTAEFVASASWFYECGYLTNINHVYSAWNQMSLFHLRSCESCDHLQKETHNWRANLGVTRCSVCGMISAGGDEVIFQSAENHEHDH